MSAWIKPLQRLLVRDWFLALVILGIYLVTNRYIYGWDDQHLEIPLLKRLIDPGLYPGDYYVDGLQQNFTSYLYPILSKLITVDQVPAAYFILFLLSRYFFFYWSFKLWDLIGRKYFGNAGSVSPKFAAFCTVVASILIGRVEEFLYRTFSHQEFAFAIIFAAIYYFYKDRFMLAAFLFGMAANFHALYALFPMLYMSVYLLFFHPERRVEHFLKTGFMFVFACLPFLLWAIPKNLQLHGHLPPEVTANWIEMYYLACPQNFPFGQMDVAQVMGNFKLLMVNINFIVVLALLYLFQVIFNEQFRRDRKIQAVTLTVVVLIFTAFYFAYAAPSRFALDLNLIRNEQYLRFLLMGYMSLFVIYQVGEKGAVRALLLAVIFMFAWAKGPFNAFILAASVLVLTYKDRKELLQTFDRRKLIVCVAVVAVLVGMTLFGIDLAKIRWDKFVVNAVNVAILAGFAVVEWRTHGVRRLRQAFVAVPLIMAFLFFCYYHYQFVQMSTKGAGFWQLQRNWEEIAGYVRDNTPKDASILAPYNTEMGGFRIHSERTIVASYRDCGIIGFDYKAALEWRQRIKDIEPFKVFTDPNSIAPAIVSGLYKYKVDYIVFMRYYAPEDNPLVRKIYENEVFALYKVTAQN
jgi:hypothetical protein